MGSQTIGEGTVGNIKVGLQNYAARVDKVLGPSRIKVSLWETHADRMFKAEPVYTAEVNTGDFKPLDEAFQPRKKGE